MIDITMTASAARPEILKKTLISIKENVIYSGKLRLILHVDYREDACINVNAVTELAEQYFPEELIIAHIKNSPVSKSQRWVWDQSLSDYVLNWEDDWEATREIDFDRLIRIIKGFRSVAMIYLDREDKGVLTCDGYKGVFDYIGGNLYRRLSGILFWSSPALVSQKYIRDAIHFIKDIEYMDVTARTPESQEFLSKWEFLTYLGPRMKGHYVRDLGRPWMKQKGLIANKQGAIGYEWEKEIEQ